MSMIYERKQGHVLVSNNVIHQQDLKYIKRINDNFEKYFDLNQRGTVYSYVKIIKFIKINTNYIQLIY